jgi:hypothetical protein
MACAPGSTCDYPTGTGLAGADLTNDQKQLLLEVIANWVGLSDEQTTTDALAKIEATLDETYVNWSGATVYDMTSGDGIYFEISGPDVFIEFASQQGSAGADVEGVITAAGATSTASTAIRPTTTPTAPLSRRRLAWPVAEVLRRAGPAGRRRPALERRLTSTGISALIRDDRGPSSIEINRGASNSPLLWIDANPDVSTPATLPSGSFHGMVLRTLLDDFERALEGLAGPVYLHVDLDVLDPSEPGGLAGRRRPPADSSRRAATIAVVQGAGINTTLADRPLGVV